MSIDRLVAWEEAMFDNAFGDALHAHVDSCFLSPDEKGELHRIMRTGWLREAIIMYIAARWLPLHFEEPDLPGLSECVLDLIGNEPSFTASRSTQLVVAIAQVLASAAWHFRSNHLTAAKN